MRCVGRFYAIAKNDIFLVEKAVKQFFIYFSMTGGASSYLFIISKFSITLYSGCPTSIIVKNLS
jgi:hypothetical protein